MKKLMISLLLGLFGHELASGVQFVDGDFAAYSIDDSSAVIWQYNGNDKNVVIPGTLTYTYDKYEYDEEGNYRSRRYSQSFCVVGIGEAFGSIGARDANLLESVIIPYGVTNIQAFAFQYCKNLIFVEMSENVRTIGRRAFLGCSALSYSNFPRGVVSIDDWAFAGCALAELNLPESIVAVGDSAFAYCGSLRTIKVAAANRYFKTLSNNLVTKDGRSFIRASACTSVVVPDGIREIANGAFSDCRVLKSVALPSSVEIIGRESFSACTALTSIVLSPHLKKIGFDAFRFCEALKSVSIPASVTSIGCDAFLGCFQTEIVFEGEPPKFEDTDDIICSSCMTVGIRSRHNLI